MKARGLKELLQVLKGMEEVEIAMSVLYKICAKRWEEDSEFWLSLSGDEVKHSQNVKKLAKIIHDRIGSEVSFRSHRPFTLNSVKSFICGIIDAMKRVKEGNVSKKRMLAIAFDIERSALERRYSELIKTDDVEYQSISKTIDTETQTHRDKIKKKLKEYQKQK
jgi:hypothetical protein